MGCWGPGLYSDDFAEDLRPVICAVCKLPKDTSELVDIIKETEPRAANDANDEDHTTFWLVLADQFHKKGIPYPEVFERAVEIIDNGSDLKMAAELGLEAGDLRKREAMLAKLRENISEPVVEKPRKTLKKPQPLIMETGDVIVYPVADEWAELQKNPMYKGHYDLCPANPYFSRTDLEESGWKPVDWGAAVIVDCGLAFGFLAWYRPLVVSRRLNANLRPSLDDLFAADKWGFEHAGTCSSSHSKKMGLEKIASVGIISERLKEIPRGLLDGVGAATIDRSISNCLSITDTAEHEFLRLGEVVTL